jgi:integrase
VPKLSQVKLTQRVVEAAEPGQCISDSGVRGFRLMVSPSGTKRFVAAYRVGSKGKSSKKALGFYPTLTVEQARELAKEVLRLARSRVDPHQPDKDAREAEDAAKRAPTLADLVTVYLDDYAPTRALKSGTIRDARALGAKACLTLGTKKVDAVSITDIRKVHGDTRAEGIAAGNKGVYQANRLLAVLSKMFSLAIERGWRTDNPCKGIAKFPEDQRWNNLSEDQLGSLFHACEDYELGIRPVSLKDSPEEAERKRTPLPEKDRSAADREAANAIRLLLYTGARLREVLRAEWPQFDLAAGLWEKPSSHTKTKRQHRLELEGEALVLLRGMAEAKSHVRFLFPGNEQLSRQAAVVDILTGEPKGVQPRTDLKRPWRTICELAGLEGVRLHDLRRTTASFMLSGGHSLATVGKTLGHTQAATTQRYATLAPSVQREALRAVGEAMMATKGRKERGIVVPFPVKVGE